MEEIFFAIARVYEEVYKKEYPTEEPMSHETLCSEFKRNTIMRLKPGDDILIREEKDIQTFYNPKTLISIVNVGARNDLIQDNKLLISSEFGEPINKGEWERIREQYCDRWFNLFTELEEMYENKQLRLIELDNFLNKIE